MVLDFTDSIARTRRYIPDLVELADPANSNAPKSYIFSDSELESFIADENPAELNPVPGYVIKRAAAYAIIALANSENLILKKLTSQDQGTDGPSVAKQLLASATVLFGQADRDEAAAHPVAMAETFTAVYPPQTTSHSFGWLMPL